MNQEFLNKLDKKVLSHLPLMKWSRKWRKKPLTLPLNWFQRLCGGTGGGTAWGLVLFMLIPFPINFFLHSILPFWIYTVISIPLSFCIIFVGMTYCERCMLAIIEEDNQKWMEKTKRINEEYPLGSFVKQTKENSKDT